MGQVTMFPWHVKLSSVKRKGITLHEHLASIAAKGGQRRAKRLFAAKKKAIAQKGGQAGGKARHKLSVAQGREIARKAVQPLEERHEEFPAVRTATACLVALAVLLVFALTLSAQDGAFSPSGIHTRTNEVVLPELEIYSEFQRVDPFGRIISKDRAQRPREILSPAIPRNGFVSFHVVVTAPPGESYFLFVGTNPLNACRVELYKEHFVKTADGWVPDTLVELRRLPDFGAIPDPDENIPGQNTRAYLLNLWVPPDTELAAFRLEVQLKIGSYIIRPLEVRVIPARVPDVAGARNALTRPVPGIDEPSDASAVGPLTEYFSRGLVTANARPSTTREVIRRNATQDMMLAGSLGQQTRPEALKRFWDALPRVPGAEGYLRLRDFVYAQSFH